MEGLLTNDASQLPFPTEEQAPPQTTTQEAAIKKRWSKLMGGGSEAPTPTSVSKMVEPQYHSDTSVDTSEGYDTFTDSSTDEDTKKRKRDKAIKKSIPKVIRKRLDRYIKRKLEESKTKQVQHEDPYAHYAALPSMPPPLPNPYILPEKQQTPEIRAPVFF